MKLLLTKDWIRYVIAVIITVIIYSVTLSLDWFQSVDYVLYDVGMALRNPPDEAPDIVLIAIDKPSMNDCFDEPHFPISRHLTQHARLVDSLRSAGTAVIVFDILFDQLEDVQDSCLDQFTSSLEKSGNVVLACAVEKEQVKKGTGGTTMLVERFCLPLQPFRSAAVGVGLINVPIDRDGGIRHVYLRKLVSGQMIPSLPVAAANVFLEKNQRIHNEADDTILVDYSWATRGFIRVPYGVVLSGKGWQSTVQGKIAIVGVTENGSLDMYTTPLSIIAESSSGRMPGVEIQAAALQTLISGTMITRLSKKYVCVLSIVFLLFLLWLISTVRPLFGLLSSGASLIMVLAFITVCVAAFGMMLQLAPLAFSIANGTIIMIVLNITGLKIKHDQQGRIMAEVDTDLSAAHEIQKKLQPVSFPKSEIYDIAGIQIPCKKVGGDYFDIVKLKDGRLGLLVADVAGKGVGGSLIMSNLQGCFRQVAVDTASPNAVFNKMNEVVKSAASIQHFFVTAWYGIFNPMDRSLIYANAGHGLPVLCTNTGKTSLLEGGEVPLGIMSDSQWSETKINLKPGDILCVYTDGITEATRPGTDEMFEEKGIISVMERVYDQDSQTICDRLLSSCREYAGGGDFDDDWTILVLKIK